MSVDVGFLHGLSAMWMEKLVFSIVSMLPEGPSMSLSRVTCGNILAAVRSTQP